MSANSVTTDLIRKEWDRLEQILAAFAPLAAMGNYPPGVTDGDIDADRGDYGISQEEADWNDREAEEAAEDEARFVNEFAGLGEEHTNDSNGLA